MPEKVGAKQFPLLLIKPTHYDDDGYPIQWFRSAIPSNTLAVLNGLALDCKDRHVLGDDVDIADHARIDETNTRVRPTRIAKDMRDGNGLVALVGVQSNQFPRAMDIARPLRAGRHAGLHRRIPCFGHALDAARIHARIAEKRWTSASRCSRAKPRAGSRWFCATPGTAR